MMWLYSSVEKRRYYADFIKVLAEMNDKTKIPNFTHFHAGIQHNTHLNSAVRRDIKIAPEGG